MPSAKAKTPKKLTVYVYEKDVKTLIETKTAEFHADGLTTTVELQLVNGKSYDILFWADAYDENGADTPFSYTASTQTVKVDYTKMASNEDKGDAFFFAEKGLEVNGAINKNITLTRPFAQINFDTDDLGAASVKNAFGITDSNKFGTVKSKLALTAAMPDQLNLFDGTVSTSATAATTFDAVAPSELTFPYGTGYDYLSMSYVLVGAGRDVVDLKYTVLNGTSEYNTLNITAVPVQRNYRTNIYGSLLTSKVNFNVVIKPNFEDPDYNVGPWDGTTQTEVTPTVENGVSTYTAMTASEFAWVITNAPMNAVIALGSDIDMGGKGIAPIGTTARKNDDSQFFQGTLDGKNMTIKNINFSGSGEDNGAGLIATAKNVTIKDLNIEGGTVTGEDFAGALVSYFSGDNNTVSNVHIKGVTVKNTTTDNGAVGGLVGRVYGATTITGCSVEGNISGRSKLGGIVGFANKNIEINSTTFEGNITSEGYPSEAHAGGIIGYTNGGNTVKLNGCTNKGNLTAKVGLGNGEIGGSYAGGMVANSFMTAYEILNCVNEGSVTAINPKGFLDGGTTTAAAGIFGYCSYAPSIKVEGCTNKGSVSLDVKAEANSRNCVAGLINIGWPACQDDKVSIKGNTVENVEYTNNAVLRRAVVAYATFVGLTPQYDYSVWLSGNTNNTSLEETFKY